MPNKSLFEVYEKNILEGKLNDWNSADLSVLTNFEINMLVAHVLYRGQEDINITYDIPTRDTVIAFKGEMSLQAYDFCKIANDAYEIMLKEGIGIRKRVTNDKWEAIVDIIRQSDNYSYDIFATDKNPLRAAMMVYLLKFG